MGIAALPKLPRWPRENKAGTAADAGDLYVEAGFVQRGDPLGAGAVEVDDLIPSGIGPTVEKMLVDCGRAVAIDA